MIGPFLCTKIPYTNISEIFKEFLIKVAPVVLPKPTFTKIMSKQNGKIYCAERFFNARLLYTQKRLQVLYQHASILINSLI